MPLYKQILVSQYVSKVTDDDKQKNRHNTHDICTDA